jgi:N2-citryl-N6-acetyl-N6-hydroxylysine synthase
VPGWRVEGSGSGPPEAFDLELPRRGLMVRARLRHYSPKGYHAFEPPLLLGDPTRLLPVGPVACLALIIEEEALVGPTSQVGRERLLARLAESRRNVQAAVLARANELERLFAGTFDFMDGEQALLCGHPIHPAPKSYDEFGCDDAIAYAPEFAAAFPLHCIWSTDARSMPAARRIVTRPTRRRVCFRAIRRCPWR